MSGPTTDRRDEGKNPAPVAPEPAPSPGAQAVQTAPAAVKRSMPMALSILLGILLAAVAAWFIKTVVWLILLLYLSFVAATVLEAPVRWLIRHGVRRGFAAILVMLGLLSTVTGMLVLLANGIYAQGTALLTNMQKSPERISTYVNGLRDRFPEIGERLGEFNFAEQVAKHLPSLEQVWRHAVSGFEIITALVVGFFVVLYMLIDGPSHLCAARTLLPKSSRAEVTRVFHELSSAHRGWAVATLVNVTSAAILTSTGLWLLGVPGALILGFVAGLGEIIPNVGPFFGALPAIIFTLLAAPEKFLYVCLMFLVVQAVQSYTITPMVMRFSVKLPVLVTIVSVLVMGTLFGLLGVIVAIPMVTDMVVLGNYIASLREKDTTDYDAVNLPHEGPRQPAAPDNTHPSRLRKLFHRERQQLNPPDARPGNGENGLDALEKAEKRSASQGTEPQRH